MPATNVCFLLAESTVTGLKNRWTCSHVSCTKRKQYRFSHPFILPKSGTKLIFFVYCNVVLKNFDMKMRLLFACLALFIATAAFAQTDVQDTFYGVKIRSSYNEMKASTDLKDIMKDKYKYYNWGYRHAYDWVDGKKERVRFPEMNFGGRNWNYCEYYFNDDKVFYQIRFYSGTKEPAVTRDTYESLLKDLKLKYSGQSGITVSEDTDWDDDQSISTVFTGDNGMTCELRYSYEAARSGQMYYYVFLYYYDRELKKEAKYKWLEEL